MILESKTSQNISLILIEELFNSFKIIFYSFLLFYILLNSNICNQLQAKISNEVIFTYLLLSYRNDRKMSHHCIYPSKRYKISLFGLLLKIIL